MQLLIVFLFMLLDIITGCLVAIALKMWNSTKMREGLFHKAGIVLTIVCAYLIDFAQNYIDIGFQVPVLTVAIVYICVMEIGSIVENIKKLNPDMGGVFNDIGGKK